MKPTREQVEELRTKGWTYGQIGEHFGIAASTAHRIVNPRPGRKLGFGSTVNYIDMKDGKPGTRSVPQGSIVSKGKNK